MLVFYALASISYREIFFIDVFFLSYTISQSCTFHFIALKWSGFQKELVISDWYYLWVSPSPSVPTSCLKRLIIFLLISGLSSIGKSLIGPNVICIKDSTFSYNSWKNGMNGLVVLDMRSKPNLLNRADFYAKCVFLCSSTYLWCQLLIC